MSSRPMQLCAGLLFFVAIACTRRSDGVGAKGRGARAATYVTSACDSQPQDICLDLIGQFHEGGGQFGTTMRDAVGGSDLRAMLSRIGAGRPAAGRYPLGLANRASHGEQLYLIFNSPARADTTRSFVSVDGEVVIDESTPERMRGTFVSTVAEYSAGWRTGRRGGGSPTTVSPDAPKVRVRGSFTLTPAPKFIQMCVGTGGPSVSVEVRDQAGRPAATGTTIVIQDGAYRDSVDGAIAWSELRVGAGERRPGRYEVRLYKPYYKPVVLKDVMAPGDSACNYAEPTDIRRVTLELVPGAPPVRSVVVFPPDAGLGGPRYTLEAYALVEASPGISLAVRWSSSDTTVVRVVATSDTSAMVCPRPRNGNVQIVATSRVDSRVRGVGRVSVMLSLGGTAPIDSLNPVGACRR